MNKSIIILVLAGLFFSCKSREKAFPLFGSKGSTEKVLHGDQLIIQASNEKNKGNIDKALELYYHSLKQGGNPAAIHYEIAQLEYEKDKNYTNALKHINKALELDESNKWYIFFYLKINEENGHMELVGKGYEKLLALYPNNIEYHLQFSDFYISQKEYDDALKVYDIIESKIGVSEKVNKNKFLIYNGLNRTDQAITELHKLIETYPFKRRYYQELIDIYKLQKDDVKVEESYQLALEQLAGNTAMLDSYAHYVFLKKEIDSAFVMHKQIIADAGYPTKEKLDIINMYKKFQRIDSTLEERSDELTKIMIVTHPKDFEVNKYMGEMFFRADDYNSSRKHFKLALIANKNSFGTWQQLVMTDHRLEDYPQMLIDAQEGISYFPAQSQLYYYAGLAHSEMDQTSKAIPFFSDGLELCSSDRQRVTFLSALGDAFHTVGNHTRSDESFEMALNIDSTNTMLLNNFAYYLSLRNIRLEKAEKMSNLSNILAPGTASYNDTYGWILYQMGKYERAAEWLLKAESNGGGDSAVIMEHIGDAYVKLKVKKIAQEYYQKAIEKGGDKEQLTKKINLL